MESTEINKVKIELSTPEPDIITVEIQNHSHLPLKSETEANEAQPDQFPPKSTGEIKEDLKSLILKPKSEYCNGVDVQTCDTMDDIKRWTVASSTVLPKQEGYLEMDTIGIVSLQSQSIVQAPLLRKDLLHNSVSPLDIKCSALPMPSFSPDGLKEEILVPSVLCADKSPQCDIPVIQITNPCQTDDDNTIRSAEGRTKTLCTVPSDTEPVQNKHTGTTYDVRRPPLCTSNTATGKHKIPRQRSYKCQECGKHFTLKYDLTRHYHRHSGERPYRCLVCDQRFASASNFSRHQRIHTGEKPYKCDVCNMEFSNSDNYNRHQRTHTGEKPSVCELGGKSFSTSSCLTKHQRSHMGEKPYRCTICNMTFAVSGNLARHQQTHTREKSFSCYICKKEFVSLSNFARHKRIHTGIKSYMCSVCGKAFSRSSGLLKHHETHTG